MKLQRHRVIIFGMILEHGLSLETARTDHRVSSEAVAMVHGPEGAAYDIRQSWTSMSSFTQKGAGLWKASCRMET